MPSWSSSCFRTFKKDAGERHPKGRNNDACAIEDRRFSLISEEKKGISFVELVKREGYTLGLIISGGVDKGCRPKISNLRPGGIAHRSDALAVGDYIVSVNGIRTINLKHEEIVNLLKNAGDRVTLEVEYEIPISADEGSFGVCPKGIQIKLEKENDSFGFTLRGGVCSDRLKSRPLTITHVRLGGPADRDGSINAGDRLLAVEGINLSAATLQEALMVLKQVSHAALLTIEYDVSVIEAVRSATGPLLIEIDKTPGNQLGINLTCLLTPKPTIVIESIRQASVAERCGALHVGDHLLAIDGSKVDLMTAAEAMQLLKASTGDVVKLEILPMSQMLRRRAPETSVKQSVTIPHYSGINGSNHNSCYNTLSSLGGISLGSNPLFPSVSSNFGRSKLNRSFSSKPRSGFSSSNPSLMSTLNYAFPVIGCVDITEVIISADHRGFGFELQGSTFASDMLTTPPFISVIDVGGPAERSGVLNVDDRVLAVNGESTEGLTLDEVNHLIAISHPKVMLTVEFDVEESVVPSSGTFVVKLAKKGASLGISVTAPKNRQPGEPLIISDVKKGSVAYRTGTIQPGDQLLAIDMIRMESCTVEDASEILFSCNEIVKLRIRKDETFSDDPDVTSAVIYTVELVRHGGPLGITLMGSNEPFHPILISDLAKNGLADRTGALHSGDTILAINGYSLRGKTVSEAICILQNCGDVVTLKISKKPCSDKILNAIGKPQKFLQSVPENSMKSYAIPSSIDSAVESWNSGVIDPSFVMPRENPKTEGSLSSREDSMARDMNLNEPSTSTTAPETQWDSDAWDLRSYRTHGSSTFTVSHSSPSDDDLENWSKVLEDLQTCGQSGLLRQIERSILGENEAKTSVQIHSNGNSILPIIENNVNFRPDALSDETLRVLNSKIDQLEFTEQEFVTKQATNASSNHHQHDEESNYVNSEEEESDRLRSLSSYSAPLPIEVFKVTLFKDQVCNNFGFSISDGLYEPGIYIKNIRSGGPAEASGMVKPFDRILQVNNVQTSNYSCDHTIPLMASSGDRIELIISRPAYDGISSAGSSTLGRNSIRQQWVEDGKHTNCYPFSEYIEPPILTKTL